MQVKKLKWFRIFLFNKKINPILSFFNWTEFTCGTITFPTVLLRLNHVSSLQSISTTRSYLEVKITLTSTSTYEVYMHRFYPHDLSFNLRTLVKWFNVPFFRADTHGPSPTTHFLAENTPLLSGSHHVVVFYFDQLLLALVFHGVLHGLLYNMSWLVAPHVTDQI